jgi:hypothetical protein
MSVYSRATRPCYSIPLFPTFQPVDALPGRQTFEESLIVDSSHRIGMLWISSPKSHIISNATFEQLYPTFSSLAKLAHRILLRGFAYASHRSSKSSPSTSLNIVFSNVLNLAHGVAMPIIALLYMLGRRFVFQ